VQSTAYAGLELGVPDGMDTACDFMDSLCRLDPGMLAEAEGQEGPRCLHWRVRRRYEVK
jgi:hypothetical protein